ncbi:hypothetical protein [Sphingomonas sp. IW22]|uniref:hypothetical protein n=1 Tax=Sphingomonas sp. IW22 TaxID=3242489 RepID=UPI00352292D8
MAQLGATLALIAGVAALCAELRWISGASAAERVRASMVERLEAAVLPEAAREIVNREIELRFGMM